MGQVNEFYERLSLNVESYDSLADDVTVRAGDVDFYRELASTVDGPVLDLGGGTGRVAWPLAEDGHAVTTLDLSEPMLAVSRARASSHATAIAARLTFVHGDMRSFDLGRTFGLAIAPGRVFQFLLTPNAQRSALDAIWRHLRPGGLFVAQLFDPRLDWCTPMDGPLDHEDRGSGRAASTGNPVLVRAVHRMNDPLTQVFAERWEFIEVGPNGEQLRREEETLRMRWTYRYEMRHLLELAGFEVEAEYSDFHRSPPRYGAEQIWLARRPAGPGGR